MPIPLLDLKQQYATIRDEVLRVTNEVYESQLFILGKRVDDFERDFAVYCQSKHAVGVSSELDAGRPGALAEVGGSSSVPSKRLGGSGAAGAVTVNDGALYERLVDYRVHGMRPKYYHRYVGGNFRIDALQAAILHVKLPHLERWSEGRRRNAAIYGELFAEAAAGERVVLPRELPRRRHVYNQYVVRFPEGQRDQVM